MKPGWGWKLLGIAFGGLALWFWLAGAPRDAGLASAQEAAARERPPSVPKKVVADEERLAAAARGNLRAEWRDLNDWLGENPVPEEAEVRRRLAETRVRWSEMDLQVLAAGIGELLEGGMDRRTGLRFQTGPHGLLVGWPTLRVFLLDVLATSDPEMAAAIARGILDETGSADEYAVAMRSLTREGPARAEDGELLARFQTLLGRDEWRGAAGFAEAFDLPRTIGTAEAAGALAAWDGDPGLKRMALEEFAAERPAVVLPAIAESEGLDGRTRALLMARADPADAGQLALVDAYFRNAAVSADEAEVFLKAFPLRTATTGYRLYGGSPRPYSREAIVAADLAALEWVSKHLGNPALADRGEGLRELKERLEEWTSQAR